MKNLILKKKMPCPRLEQVLAYVKKNGWEFGQTFTRKSDQVSLWDEYIKGELSINVICSEHFSDYEWRTSELIGELAMLENRDTLDVYNDIMRPDSITVTLKLEEAHRIVDALDHQIGDWSPSLPKLPTGVRHAYNVMIDHMKAAKSIIGSATQEATKNL